MGKYIYAVYGASGFGREVMHLACEQRIREGRGQDQLFFVDDNPASTTVNGHNCLTYEQFMDIEATERHVTLAIANSRIREKLVDRLLADDVILWNIKSSNAVVMDCVTIGCGSILCPFVTITSNIYIGKCFHANIYSYVAHDCNIGDFVTLAPGAKCNGNVKIEDHAYIATGAIIRQGKPGNPIIIGKGSTVGMGAVVTKNVPAGTTVVGNPAAPLSKEALRRK